MFKLPLFCALKIIKCSYVLLIVISSEYIPPNSSKVTLDWSLDEVDGLDVPEATSAWAAGDVSSTDDAFNLSVAAPIVTKFKIVFKTQETRDFFFTATISHT